MQFTKTTLFAVALIALTSAQSALAATPPAQPNNGQVKPPNNGGEKVSNIANDHSNGNLSVNGNNNNNGATQGQGKTGQHQKPAAFQRQRRHRTGSRRKHQRSGVSHENKNGQTSTISHNPNGPVPDSKVFNAPKDNKQ
ncbi:hypothetical protein IWQ62_006500 [Dispira parvispora]|uniref:Uncharacterized protein n=1 Tax=Dispira parvispora TaxID=1520584 RepID=A0A9W8E492_9FUNG|nr:hypothetical protein IWQ62_006500 [Dispira parvispora]